MKTNWPRAIPFLLVHAIALTAVFAVPFHWKYVALAIGSYYVRMFFITSTYHRYFSHRAFKLNRFWQFVWAWCAQTSVQKGALWWAANHRVHHKNSDRPDDVHSPSQRGFWHSHVGWVLSTEHEPTRWEQIPDLARYPELRWLNRHYLHPAVIYAVAFFLAGGWPALVWGFFVSTTLLWHGTFTINSLSHVYGTRRYETADTSTNNPWLTLITLGEGWHNNHHCYMASANQGFMWWELDVTYYVLKAASWIGVVKELRKAPVKMLDVRRVGKPARAVSSSLRERTTTPLRETSDARAGNS